MKKAFFITLLFCFLVESANSEIVELKCKPDGNDEYSIELSVDLENRTININSPFPPYEIIAVTDEYITAIQSDDDLGGEVWVQSRTSGRYWRGGVSLFCTDNTCTSQKIRKFSYEGTCKRRLL